jgi:glycosyltransferase involved in cell wall biosynthesis
MRVLYLLWNYPQISETYIDAEIGYAIGCGIDVHVWSTACRHPNLIPSCEVHRGTLADTLAKVKPHIVHCHYLPLAEAYHGSVPKGVPITVRGHSFDWSQETLRRVAGLNSVKRIYLFPHFAVQVKDVDKVRALPVAFRPRQQKDVKKDRRLVLRLAAALPTKGLQDFFAVAERLADDFRFVLGVSRAGSADDYPERLVEMSRKMGGIVDVRIDVLPDDAWDLYRKASIYLETSDPKGHPFGMPISIAEAWSEGMLVLARDGPDARRYVGEDFCYSTVAEASELIADTREWSGDDWDDEDSSSRRRAEPFQADRVLPTLIEDWCLVANGK